MTTTPAENAKLGFRVFALIVFLIILFHALSDNDATLSGKISEVAINSGVLLIAYFFGSKSLEKTIEKKESELKEKEKRRGQSPKQGHSFRQ